MPASASRRLTAMNARAASTDAIVDTYHRITLSSILLAMTLE
jgi:hypothetical protein